MNVKELIVRLLDFPPDAPVCFDAEDGLVGNFEDVTGVATKTNGAGEMFITLKSDSVGRVK